MRDDRLIVGRVMKVHGIRGEVAVEVLSDVADRFAPGATLMVDDDLLTIESTRPHQGRLLVKFEQIQDRTAAEGLRGAAITVDAEDARPLPEWSFYPHELEGLAVLDENGAELGRFERVLEAPANDIWVVRAGSREIMVPAVRAFIVAVDVPGGTITLRPPEGLF